MVDINRPFSTRHSHDNSNNDNDEDGDDDEEEDDDDDKDGCMLLSSSNALWPPTVPRL